MARSILLCCFVAVFALSSTALGSMVTVTTEVDRSEVEVGDTFTVSVYVEVTDNEYEGTPLGFSNLYVNVTTPGTVEVVGPKPEEGLGGPTGNVVMNWGSGFDAFNKIKGFLEDLDGEGDDDAKWIAMGFVGSSPGPDAYGSATVKTLLASLTYEGLSEGTATVMPICDESNTRIWDFDGSAFDKVDPGSFSYEGSEVTVVPEPITLALLGVGGVGLLARRRRRR